MNAISGIIGGNIIGLSTTISCRAYLGSATPKQKLPMIVLSNNLHVPHIQFIQSNYWHVIFHEFKPVIFTVLITFRYALKSER